MYVAIILKIWEDLIGEGVGACGRGKGKKKEGRFLLKVYIKK